MEKKIWLVEFPVFRYTQDVKDIARKGNLKIIDMKYKDNYATDRLVEKRPTLTLKAEYKSKEEAPAS